jgi:FkbM family methyltransferase
LLTKKIWTNFELLFFGETPASPFLKIFVYSYKMKKLFYAFFKTKLAKMIISFIYWFNASWRQKMICKIPGADGITLRKNTSDPSVFWQVFVEKEYDIPLNINPKLIIDGGANIGCATLWFRKKYPEAQIIAIEPEESNFKILEENTKKLDQVKIIKAGIWNKNTTLKIDNPGLGKWGFETKEADSSDKNSLTAITIDKILADSGCKEIDILKLDIEGSEKEVFESGYENWLDKTKVIIIELHERMREGSEKSFYSAIAKYNFEKKRHGENIIMIKKDKAI